jgi:hypothetical protein
LTTNSNELKRTHAAGFGLEFVVIVLDRTSGMMGLLNAGKDFSSDPVNPVDLV